MEEHPTLQIILCKIVKCIKIGIVPILILNVAFFLCTLEYDNPYTCTVVFQSLEDEYPKAIYCINPKKTCCFEKYTDPSNPQIDIPCYKDYLSNECREEPYPKVFLILFLVLFSILCLSVAFAVLFCILKEVQCI